MQKRVEKFLIIDSNSVLRRAYYALPPLKTKKGEILNAVYGFLLIFLRALKELQPKFVAATFDLKGPTFRHKEFKEYKAKRVSAPPEFYQQVERAKEILRLFNISIFGKKGFEADDLIGTLNFLASKEKDLSTLQIIILTGDLDILQLVNPQTKVWTMKKGIKEVSFYGEEEVKKKYDGLEPSQLNDMKGLKGDASDNIPGVPGIGEKTAIKLIKQFGSLDKLYSVLDENEKGLNINQQQMLKLKKYKKQAFLSKKLCQIRQDTPIKFNLKKCRFGEIDTGKLIELFKNLEFQTLISRLPGQEEITSSGQKKMNFAIKPC